MARYRTASKACFGYAYAYIGQPERTVDWCRAQLARGSDTHFARRTLVIALVIANSGNEARAATDGLIEAAEATRNPRTLAFALYAYGVAFRNADPDRAREALHRSLVIAHDSGNRGDESNLAAMLAGLEALHGDPLAAFDYVTMAIRNHHDSGNHTHVRLDLAELAVILHRLRRHESAATIAGFALTPLTSGSPRAQRRDHPPARSPRRPDLRIARPQGRNDDHRRNGDLRIRPNRPGPSRTEGRLEIDIRVSRKSVSESPVRIPLKSLAAEPAFDSFGDCLPSRLKHHHVAHVGEELGVSLVSPRRGRHAPRQLASRRLLRQEQATVRSQGEHRQNGSLDSVRHARSRAPYGPRRT